MVLGGDFTEIANTCKVIVGSGLGNDYDDDNMVEMILGACSRKRLQLHWTGSHQIIVLLPHRSLNYQVRVMVA